MRRHRALSCLAAGVVLAFCAQVSPASRADGSFLRSAVETVPPHERIAAPIRTSVESVPLRTLRQEYEQRLPLRDAVEKRPDPFIDIDNEYLLKTNQNSEEIISPAAKIKNHMKHYYGAANFLNKNNERLQHGNANLQEMQQTATGPSEQRMVVCYMESWAAYRAPPLSFTSGLVPRVCTHLHYAFAAIHPHTYAITPANEDYDIIKGGYRIATGLKRNMPGLRVIIGVGGEGTERLFSEMLQEAPRRRAFVDSVVAFLKEHDFDGLELHWRYSGEDNLGEKEQLTALLYELREKFSSYGLLLSTILPPFRYQIEDGYDISAVSGATDYAILQAWDITHGKSDEPPNRALQHSALYRDPGAAARDRPYDNIEFLVKFILRQGMAADKLVLGVPLFGRSYTLAASTLPAPGAPVNGWGNEGQYTQTKGLLSYFEICMAEQQGNSVTAYDEVGNSYAVFDNQWISYDTLKVIEEKMKYVISTGLAGAAAWAIDMDDFRGLCGSAFPLLNTIAYTLNGEPVKTDQSTLKIGTCDTFAPYLASDEQSCAHYQFCSRGTNYRLVCEENRLYDPSTGFCGHQDAAKCLPGESLRISISDAARFLNQAYETDFEWKDRDESKSATLKSNEQIIVSPMAELKKNKDNDKRVVCYTTSWAFYRRGDGKFVPEHIDTRLCTHVVYAYASLSPDELIVKEFDAWADINNNLYERMTSLNDVKVLLGLGGWTDSSGDKYSRLVSSSAARAKFIEKLVSFLNLHNFQGLHLDWNYPVCWQSNCIKGARSDKSNFAKLVQELSKSLHAKNMELGVAISGYKEVFEAGYDLPALSNAADFLTVMTYDYHGGWERSTGHHTTLVPSSKDSLPYYSIEYSIKAIIAGGADPKKLNLGLAFYGQTYRLADSQATKGPGTPALGPGEPGEFTKQPGMLAYYEICYRVKNLRWKVGRQENAGPYSYLDNQWVGYDDPQSVTEKVQWALRQGLGGVTAWAIDLDDFNNRCCAEPSPLLRAAGRALGRDVPPPPSSSCERPPEPITPAPPTTTTVASDGSAGGGHGDHGSHGGHDQMSTTWPSWNPSATQSSTTQTWWPSTTTKRTTAPMTTQRTTTTTTSAPAQYPPENDLLEGAHCVAGEYHKVINDCESYLQCLGGQWKKTHCAAGLHWNDKAKRCDWPNYAKCTPKPSSSDSTVSSTMAPVVSRPPPPRPSTTRKPTTTTTTRKPTTFTTKKPYTTNKPIAVTDDFTKNSECNGHGYKPVSNNCNAYLHCDGTMWITQNCAPGLHWSANANHCDWPKYAKCEESSIQQTTSAPKPIRPAMTTRKPSTSSTSNNKIEGGHCGAGDSHASSDSCDSYLQCVGNSWRKQLCPPGLQWDKRTMRCDWAEYAMCDMSSGSNKAPIRTTTYRPSYTRPSKPTTPSADTSLRPGQKCRTGTYYTHPRCEKFFVCVNNVLVAQSCAPGLLWRPDRSQCDFPSTTSCNDRRHVTSTSIKENHSSQMMQLTACENGEYSIYPGDCSRYRHCLFGKFEEFSCSIGLHWNQEKQTCDWPFSAKCNEEAELSDIPYVEPVLGGSVKPALTTTEPRPTSAPIFPPTINPIMHNPTTTLPTVDAKPDLINSHYKLVCYFTNWAWYRPGIGKYVPEDIDPSICTHVVYGFAVLGHDGVITAHDSWADYDNRFYERVVAFKKQGIKVSLAVGGWNDSAGDKYSRLVNNPSARAKFVRHAVQFLEKYDFDGLDLDWEYPKCWQVDCSKGPDSDKDGFSALVRELAEAFEPKGFLLSSAVSPNKKVIDAGYDVPVLARHMDWIAVMTYDYHGQWDKKTGHVAPLYYHPDDDTTYFNANYTMHYWIEKGAPPSKLVMGIPLYGQSFTTGTQWDTPIELLAKKNETGLNIPARTGGQAGEFTRAKGFLAYYEICERLKNRGWQVVKDPLSRMGPYAFKGDQWVSFDDVDIIKKKVNFIKSLNLAGGMVWALDLDDFKNRCGQGKHPLLNTIKNGLLESSNEQYVHPEPMIIPPKIPEEDDNDIEVTPAISKKPTTPCPQLQTTQRHSGTSAETITPTIDGDQYKVVCYFTNWAWYRPGSGKYTPSDIDPALCTHIVYAFAVLDGSRLVIKPHDIWADIDNKFFEKVLSYKSRGIKVLLGLGGWNDSAGSKYSRLVNSPSARRTFVVHALDFIEQYGFDGLDLDWEYPKCWQVECEKGPTSDKQGFADLVSELRQSFAPKKLLLTAAVSPSKRVIDAGYDVPVLSKNLDWIAVMTYDYHGQWDKKTGHVAPMYSREDDDDKTFNANFTIHYWIKKGAARNKLVMGMPMYGQSFSLSETTNTGLSVPTYAGGEAGDETRARGFLAYYEICERIRIRGWKVIKDPGGRIGPYATLGDQWVSFDDDFMIRHKAEYIRAMGLGGGMIWALDLDDFTGKYCGCGKSPLLRNINHVLRGLKAPQPCPLEEISLPDSEFTTEIVAGVPSTTHRPHHHDIHELSSSGETHNENELSLEGTRCTGNTFTSDPIDCGKYYLCNNGEYIQLACPQPLHWNKNHCDWPSKSNCKNKAQIRISSDDDTAVEQPIAACYFTNWAYYRVGDGSYGPDQVDASLCTHIIYTWAHLDEKTYKLIPGNAELDIENDFYGKITELRLKGLKVILGVGGLQNSEGDKWRNIIADQHKRNIFINSALKILERWNFDGLQISWQYPVCSEVPCTNGYLYTADRDSFNALLLELSKEMRPRNLELSVAVSANPEIASKAYDHHVLAGTVDWLAIAANDYHISSSTQTALLSSQVYDGETKRNNFNVTMQYWLSVMAPRLLVMGIPAYARTYTLADTSISTPEAPARGPGEPGLYTSVSGFLAYYEICHNVVFEEWKEIPINGETYAVSGDQWATYLRPNDVHTIAVQASQNGMRGVALWALDLDDWRGSCSSVPHPLLRAIRQALLRT